MSNSRRRYRAILTKLVQLQGYPSGRTMQRVQVLAACRRKGGLRQIYDKFHCSESDLRRFSGHNVRIWVPSRAKPDVSPDCGRAETKLVHTRS